jgi:hypothetical protein
MCDSICDRRLPARMGMTADMGIPMCLLCRVDGNYADSFFPDAVDGRAMNANGLPDLGVTCAGLDKPDHLGSPGAADSRR